MAAQTKPVDVLAVMDSCTDELEKQPGCYYTDAAKLQEARAAIAELIESAAVVVEPYRGDAYAGPDIERLEAALARVGGAL